MIRAGWGWLEQVALFSNALTLLCINSIAEHVIVS